MESSPKKVNVKAEKHEYKQLSEQAANGDTKAFARLYETVYREMYYAAYYSLSDDTDAVEAVVSSVREGFAAVGRLHTEDAFRVFMMKSVCSRIKIRFKEYAAEGIQVSYDAENLRPDRDGVDIKQEFNRLPDTERLLISLHEGGRFTAEEISQFTGLTASTVGKKLARSASLHNRLMDQIEGGTHSAASLLHDLISRKIVPESIVPQNISSCLIDDENSAPPELDAFTFLNRLRALGIGSADFLYLLKGCEAPPEAIEKIENDPAMNLQKLIVTLDGAGLTPKDYTRMLYTARQIWERTVTMRLRQANAESAEASDTDEDYELEEYASSGEDSSGNTAEFAVNTDEEDYDREEEDTPEESPAEEDHAPPQETERVILTGRSRLVERLNEVDDDDDDDDERTYPHKGSLTAAACGAAVLVGLCFTLNAMGFSPERGAGHSLHYAEDSSEIFAEIYKAYNSGRIGGSDTLAYTTPDCVVFGELLISLPEDLGVFTFENYIFAVQPEKITLYSADGTNAVILEELSPPEGTRYVMARQSEGGLSAAFSGKKSCGVIGYAPDGSMEFLSEQCGAMTALSPTEDGFSIGSVYVPEFTESFSSQQTEYYLPWTAFGGKRSEVPPEQIMLTGDAEGCSYAVYAEHRSGGVSDCAAVLGDPVYSGAEGFSAVMNSGGRSYLAYVGEEGSPGCVDIERALACAGGSGKYAAAHISEDGSAAVYIYGEEHEAVSALTNLPGEVTAMRIEERFGRSILYLYGAEGVLAAADITSAEEPFMLSLTTAYGTVVDNTALCGTVSQSGIRLAVYTLGEDGSVSETASCAKTFSGVSLDTLELCGGNTFLIGTDSRYGAAYSYFDGVSRVSELAMFGKRRTEAHLFDDKEGFTVSAQLDGKIYLIHGDKTIIM